MLPGIRNQEHVSLKTLSSTSKETATLVEDMVFIKTSDIHGEYRNFSFKTELKAKCFLQTSNQSLRQADTCSKSTIETPVQRVKLTIKTLTSFWCLSY